MDRHRETFSTCARLLLIGLAASCAPQGDEDVQALDPADQAAADIARHDDHTAIALTEGGLLRGTQTATTRVFRGIPYAAAPVGALRWKPPERAARWRGIRDATQFANHCPQVAGAFGQ